MTENEATALAGDIVETWPLTSSKRIWRDELTTWADPDAARRAYHKLRRHREGRDMDIATFATAYRKERKAATPAEPASDACHDSDAISLGEYYTRLLARADRGDPDAAEELAIWDRNPAFLTIIGEHA